jgi:hypothetical protein
MCRSGVLHVVFLAKYVACNVAKVVSLMIVLNKRNITFILRLVYFIKQCARVGGYVPCA